MHSFGRIGRNDEYVVLIFAPFEYDHEEFSRTRVTDSFYGAAVSWLDRDSELKHFLDFPHRDIWMAFFKMDSTILLASKHEFHLGILVWAPRGVNRF